MLSYLHKLFLLLILVLFLELIILIPVGRYLGFWPTVLLLLAFGFLGVVLVRTQGLSAWHRIRSKIAAGSPPGEVLLDGLLLFLAGLMLIIPGLLTAAIGLLLLLPSVRATARVWLSRWLVKMLGNRLGWRL